MATTNLLSNCRHSGEGVPWILIAPLAQANWNTRNRRNTKIATKILRVPGQTHQITIAIVGMCRENRQRRRWRRWQRWPHNEKREISHSADSEERQALDLLFRFTIDTCSNNYVCKVFLSEYFRCHSHVALYSGCLGKIFLRLLLSSTTS